MVSKKRREMITLMLILPIKKKWFDMILSGEKKEEYREIKPYYTSRFKKLFMMCPNSGFTMPGCSRQEILFRNGYRKDSPSFVAECSLDMGEGKKEWGAEKGKEYYILKTSWENFTVSLKSHLMTGWKAIPDVLILQMHHIDTECYIMIKSSCQ